MSKSKYDVLGPIYADLGGELARVVGGNPDGTYLYAEAGDGWFGYGIFKDEGAIIRYYRPTSELGDLLREAWDMEDADKRWAVMEYEIKGTSFDARFKFPGEVNVEWFDIDRRDAAAMKHFGEKPIVYPPPVDR